MTMDVYQKLENLLATPADWPVFEEGKHEFTVKRVTVGNILGIAANGTASEPLIDQLIEHQAAILAIALAGAKREIKSEYPQIDVSEIEPFLIGKYPARDALRYKIHAIMDDPEYENWPLTHPKMKELNQLTEEEMALPPRLEELKKLMDAALKDYAPDSPLVDHFMSIFVLELMFDKFGEQQQKCEEFSRSARRLGQLVRLGVPEQNILKEIGLLQQRLPVLKEIFDTTNSTAFDDSPTKLNKDSAVGKIITAAQEASEHATYALGGIIEKLNEIVGSGQSRRQAL